MIVTRKEYNTIKDKIANGVEVNEIELAKVKHIDNYQASLRAKQVNYEMKLKRAQEYKNNRTSKGWGIYDGFDSLEDYYSATK